MKIYIKLFSFLLIGCVIYFAIDFYLEPTLKNIKYCTNMNYEKVLAESTIQKSDKWTKEMICKSSYQSTTDLVNCVREEGNKGFLRKLSLYIHLLIKNPYTEIVKIHNDHCKEFSDYIIITN
ncbi:hypothetical protein C4561_02830 [candidate division WWE3 bacterium]|jgi:hypothetical protein|uniref:Uncharacterized protein n=1 Tax=candidate division WWE3 bacterium TaxID=2053526 RepID=A0A3A4ZDA5_UNCKA|nr:MAG: hypothetical protein C4561_02830 [candidate division WWE3 bacterium]